jgi:hypothetical protein
VFCWVLFEEDHIRLELSWRGESISVQIPPHKATSLAPGQSMGIGYWDRQGDPELANRIAVLAARRGARNARGEPRVAEAERSLREEPAQVEISEQPAPLQPQKPLPKVLPKKATRRDPSVEATAEWGVWQPEGASKIGQGLGWSLALGDRVLPVAIERAPGGDC